MSVELSVIIPSYNTGEFIPEAILSVAQDVPEAEIIVVDDASSDNTAEIVDQLKLDSLKYIQLTENSPGGAGYPSNVGIEQARGEYIAFVDSDDFFYRGYLSQMLEYIKFSGSDLCVSAYQLVDTVTHAEAAAHDHRMWSSIVQNSRSGVLSKEQYFTLSPEPWRKIYNARLFSNENVRFPVNGWFNEDFPFHWFAGLESKRGISYLNSSAYLHRVSRQGQTTAALDERIFFVFDHSDEILQFMKSNDLHGDYREYLLNWLLIGAWKITRLSVEQEKYYHRYRSLLLSFDQGVVEKFQRIALPRQWELYQVVESFPELSDARGALIQGERRGQ